MTTARVLRADLHVHSYHSGYANHLKFLRARDCYSEPEAVYRAAKARGMDVVTITDHDSIDGCLEFLSRHPDADDFFVSEEIECRLPGTDLKVHVGAYGITERIHREIQPLRRNVIEAADYLRAEGVFFALNHPFFFYTEQVPLHEYLDFALRTFPACEVRNGTMLPEHNRLVETIVRAAAAQGVDSPAAIGGSDSHTLHGIGTTYTEVPGSDPRTFLEGLRTGKTAPGGRHGSAAREAREIYGVVGKYWASLAGLGRHDLSWKRRALGIAFSMGTLGGEFTPLVIAALHKRAERARVAHFGQEYERQRRQPRERPIELSAALGRHS